MKGNNRGLEMVVVLAVLGITVLGFLTVQKPNSAKPVAANIASGDVEMAEVTAAENSAEKTAKTVSKKSHWSCEDSSFDYQTAVSPKGLVAVAGGDNWLSVNDETGKSKVETNPRVYLCKAGEKKARELSIPRVSVFNKKTGKDEWTNRGFHKAACPMFIEGWLVTTITLREDEVALVGWDLSTKTKRNKVLYCWEECEEPSPSSETLAFRYLAKVKDIKFPVPDVGAHEIKVDQQTWTR